jgi:hypothetical protein
MFSRVLSQWGAFLILMILFSCQQPIEEATSTWRDGGSLQIGQCVDFDQFAVGTIIDELYTSDDQGPIKIQGINPRHPDENYARIFDSDLPPPAALDLGTPNNLFGGPGVGDGGSGTYYNAERLYKILIVAEDLVATEPVPTEKPDTRLLADFSALGTIVMHEIRLINVDQDENPGYIDFLDAQGQNLSQVAIPSTGSNGVVSLDIDSLPGVAMAVFQLNGDVGIADFCFDVEVSSSAEIGCTRTIGYWKNHAGNRPNQEDLISQHLPIWLGFDNGARSIKVSNAEQAYDILSQNVYGSPSNGITKLYAQLLAAKLNQLEDANSTAIVPTIQYADQHLSNYDYTVWAGLSDLRKQKVLQAKDKLDAFNNGLMDVPHCE